MKRIASFVLLFLFLVVSSYSPQIVADYSFPPQVGLNGNIDVYVMDGRLNWKASFNEPFEILYLILYDTTMVGLTTQEEHKINVTPIFIEEYLAVKERKISDIAIIVHNHHTTPFMSWSNGLFLKALRNMGFNGSFGVYHVPTDTIKWAGREE